MNEYEEEVFLRKADYATFPARLPGYSWYRPLLTGLLLLVLHTAIGTVLLFAVLFSTNPGSLLDRLFLLTAGYDGFDFTDPAMIFVSVGLVALLLPVLMLSVKITKERPFNTFSSMKGGFRYGVFFRSLIPAVIALLPDIVITFISERTVTHPTFLCFLLITVLGPFQCIAEEYVFRGLVMQTIGSWTGRWVLGLIGQMGIFALMHPYDLTGVLSICAMALAFGITAWYTKGLEAPSALHVANNMFAYYAILYGFGELSSDADTASLILTLFSSAVYVILVIFFEKKYGWYDAEKRS